MVLLSAYFGSFGFEFFHISSRFLAKKIISFLFGSENFVIYVKRDDYENLQNFTVPAEEIVPARVSSSEIPVYWDCFKPIVAEEIRLPLLLPSSYTPGLGYSISSKAAFELSRGFSSYPVNGYVEVFYVDCWAKFIKKGYMDPLKFNFNPEINSPILCQLINVNSSLNLNLPLYTSRGSLANSKKFYDSILTGFVSQHGFGVRRTYGISFPDLIV